MSERGSLPVVGDVTKNTVGVAVALVLLLLAPLILPSYFTGLVLDAMILAVFVLGFNQLFGYTGLLSFGHAAYYGTGAYVTAIVLSHDFIPEAIQSLVPAILLGVLAALFVAGVFGALCVQRGEIYFAMLTLAFSMMLYRLAIQWDSLTGGVNGLIISSPVVDLGVVQFSALDTTLYYYFTFVIAVAAVALLWRIVNSPYGELLKTIRENPDRAAFIGLPVKRYQWTSFVISGGIAGLAGGLAAVRTFVITPGSVHWLKSAEPVIITLLGGPGVFVGPIVGTGIFIGLEELLTNLTTYWQFGLGIVLIPLVLYAQNGVTGLILDREEIDWIPDRVARRREEPPSDVESGSKPQESERP